MLALVGTPVLAVGQEELHQSRRQFLRHLGQVHPLARAGRTLDLQAVAVEVVIPLQGLDEQIVHREPDRAAPVGVAAEEVRVRFAGNVLHPELLTAAAEDVGIVPVVLRQRADAVGGEELVFVEHVAEHPFQSLPRGNRQQVTAPRGVARPCVSM